MKRNSKKKGQKKSRGKGRTGKWFLLAILIGIGLSVGFLFRGEIFDALKPRLAKQSLPKEKRDITLYFSDREGEYLIGEKRQISKKGKVEEEAEEMIAELIRGPKGKLIPTLPPQTKLLTLQLDESGVAEANFNRALSEGHPGGSSAEMMTVYSVVNSLAFNFPEIKGVQILIEGKEIESIAGHLALIRPISANFDLVKKPEKNHRNN